MKQARKLKRAEKEIVSNNHLNAANWVFVSETDSYLKIMNKETSKQRNIPKTAKKVNRY